MTTGLRAWSVSVNDGGAHIRIAVFAESATDAKAEARRCGERPHHEATVYPLDGYGVRGSRVRGLPTGYGFCADCGFAMSESSIHENGRCASCY